MRLLSDFGRFSPKEDFDRSFFDRPISERLDLASQVIFIMAYTCVIAGFFGSTV